MKATDFWKSNYPDIVGIKVDEDGNIIEKVDLGILLESYHQAKLKLCGIADVLGQSEQFYCKSQTEDSRGLSCLHPCGGNRCKFEK